MATLEWASLGIPNTGAASGTTTVSDGAASTNVTLTESGNVRYFSTYGPGTHLVSTRSTGPDDTTMEFTTPISDVSFDIYDLEQGGNWQDVVTITAYDSDGNVVPVGFSNLTTGVHAAPVANMDGSYTVASIGSVTPVSYDGAATSTNDSITVNIAGPVSRIEVSFTGGSINASHQIVGISDLNFNIVCFTNGSFVQTADGKIAVEDIRQGDLIVTRDSGLQPVKWIGSRTINSLELTAMDHLRPILISKDSIAPGMPNRDMRVSPQHKMLVQGWRPALLFSENEVLAPAKGLVNERDIRQDVSKESITYFHLMFDKHEVVLVDGVCSESFFPGTQALSSLTDPSRTELFEIFPEICIDECSYGSPARQFISARDSMLLNA